MNTLHAQNLKSAMNMAFRSLGLDPAATDSRSLPYSLRIQYTRNLAAIIVQYPDRFDPGVVDAAKAELQHPAHGALENYTFSEVLTDLGSGALDGAAGLTKGFTFSLGAGITLGIAAVLVIAALRYLPAKK